MAGIWGDYFLSSPFPRKRSTKQSGENSEQNPGKNSGLEGPNIEKIQSRDARLKNSKFQSRNETFDRECVFQSDPSLAAEKRGLGLKFSSENESFEPRMNISSENDFFVRVGMVFSSDRARMDFLDLWALLGAEIRKILGLFVLHRFWPMQKISASPGTPIWNMAGSRDLSRTTCETPGSY